MSAITTRIADGYYRVVDTAYQMAVELKDGSQGGPIRIIDQSSKVQGGPTPGESYSHVTEGAQPVQVVSWEKRPSSEITFFNQVWLINLVHGPDQFKLTNVRGGGVLELPDGENVPAQQGTWDPKLPSQLWRIDQSGDGYSFINVKSNMALNLQQSQGVSQDGLAITGKTSDQGAYQTWALEKINV